MHLPDSKDPCFIEFLSTPVPDDIFIRAIEICNRVAQSLPPADPATRIVRALTIVAEEMKLEKMEFYRVGMRVQAMSLIFHLKDRVAPWIETMMFQGNLTQALLRARQ